MGGNNIVHFPKLIYRLKTVSEFQQINFFRRNKLILKFMWDAKDPR